MWALVDTNGDNSVTEVISAPKSMTIDGIKHPKDIFSLWSESELNAVRLFTIVRADTGDTRFHDWDGDAKYTYDASSKKVTETIKLIDKDLANFKVEAKATARQDAYEKMRQFGWMVQRVTMDSSKTIPTSVTDYCAKIRKDCEDICSAIDAASNMTEMKALYTDTVVDGKVTEVARVNRWSDDSSVKDLKR
jgi:hypothetical protein|tara:strand:- start:314 stop:889 length:576 start_codon:yes stop_codon:yes gene_type:complete